MLLVCAASIFCVIPPANAQPPACGLTSVAYTNHLIYLPIAIAAHIDGTVILMVRFKPDGDVQHIAALSGNLILQNASIAFVKNAKANEYSGPRECPVVISFYLTGPTARECDPTDEKMPVPPQPENTDPQHISISRKNVCVTVERDPSSFLIHHFLFLHWSSKH
jgi:hypothetical protein